MHQKNMSQIFRKQSSKLRFPQKVSSDNVSKGVTKPEISGRVFLSKMTCTSIYTSVCLVVCFIFLTVCPAVFAQTSQTFTTNGSFTVPSGVTSLKVEVWGGGGGGGGSTSNGSGGSGGGGGSYCSGVATGYSGTQSIIVGAGGTGGTNSTTWNGTNGGNSSAFGLIAYGGIGGKGNTGAIGTGGSAIGGTVNTKGGDGIRGASSGGAGGIGANGGAGGVGGSNAVGGSGVSPGGGGGGGEYASGASKAGGAGAKGQIVLTWITVSASSTSTNLGESTGAITATASGGTSYTYSLDGTNFQSENTFSGLSAGTYTVYAKDISGCKSYTTVVIQARPIYYVRAYNGNNSNTGLSWSQAFATVQKAVETANAQTPKGMVCVAAGDYYHDSAYDLTEGYQTYTSSTGYLWYEWSNNFLMRDGVNVYGGFREYKTTDNNSAGFQDRLLLSNDPNYATVLHGGDKQRVLGPLYSLVWNSSATNYDAALLTGFANSTTWDGFTITGANMIRPSATDTQYDECCGAGVFMLNNSTISHCVIENNIAGGPKDDGAGALMLGGGNLLNCIVRHNKAYYDGSGNCSGGAIRMIRGNAKVINCLIYDNSAEKGGAINLSLVKMNTGTYAPSYIVNNTIANNSSPDGPGLRVKYASAVADDNGDYTTIRCYVYNNALWDGLTSAASGSTYPSFKEAYNTFKFGYVPPKNANTTLGVLGTGSFLFGMTNTGSSNAPYFVSPGTSDPVADYRLQGVFSTLYNKGTSVVPAGYPGGAPTPPTSDLRGLYRKNSGSGVPDIGCYEVTPRVFYVNDAASNKLNEKCRGRNWTYPYASLQFALDQYDQYDFPQVWVAKSSAGFIPTKNAAGTNVSDATATFILRTNLSLIGGFTGAQASEFAGNYNEIFTKPTQRTDLITNKVRLSSPIATSIVSYNPAATETYVKGTGSTTWAGATIDGFTISGTLAGSSAVVLPDSATLRNCQIISNLGDALSTGAASSVSNALITDNAGNAVTLRGTNAIVTNATIANNGSYAIAVPGGNGSATLTNSIIWGNKANFDALADTAKITATYTALSTASASNDIPLNKWISFTNGTGNINLFHRSPNFKKRKENYELQLISPCLDAGLLSVNSQSIDVYGQPRSYGGKIDMGAIQKQSGDGIYANSGTNTFSYFRASGTPSLSNLTDQEVLVKPVSVINLGGSTTVKPKALFIQDDNTTAPVIYNGSIKADSTLYLRKLTKYRSNGVAYWTFMGFPFASARLDSIDGLKIENSVRADQYTESIRAINGANKSAWKPYMGTNLTDPNLKWFVPGRGYAASLNAKVPDKAVSTTLIVPAQKGTIISDATATLTDPVSYTETSRPWYDKGWNLIANPFARTAKFGSVPLWDANPYTSGSIWLYIADQDTYDVIPTVSSYYTDNGLSAYGTFFIQTYSTATSTSTAEISTSGNGTTPLRTKAFPFSTRNEVKPEVFRLHLEGNGLKYNTYVIFNDSARAEATAIEDAPTMGGLSGNSIQMSTFATGSDLALSVNTLPFTGTSMEIPLSVTIQQQGSYTFSLQESSKSKTVYLVDPAGATHNISKESYTADIDSTGSFSYKLVFEKKDESHDKEDLLEKWGIHIYESHGKVIITSKDPLIRVYLFRMNQQLVRAMANCGNNFQFHLPFPGAYLVKVTTEKGTFSRIVVKH
jgi:hypothetical protein